MNNIFKILLFLLLNSCVFIRQDDSIDLGNGYRFIQDYPQTIIYHPNEKYEGVGKNIVPPIVFDYNFNDRYIIAKSREADAATGSVVGKSQLYWIIDKTAKKIRVESMDSLIFYEQLEEMEINLVFNR